MCIFEGIRAYSSKSNLYIFRLKDHVEGLYDSARIYQMHIQIGADDFSKAIIETIRRSDIHDDCYIRPIVYRGELPSLGVKQMLSAPIRINILVQLRKRMINEESLETGKKASISSWRRIPPDAMPLKAKCAANYANGYLTLMDAVRAGTDYPIILDHRGFVSEGYAQNLFAVKHKKLLTPPSSSSILIGITRDTIMELAKDLGYEVKEKNITRDDLYTADEVFLCGTACEIVPLTEIDGLPIINGAGEITRRIASYYVKVVTRKVPEHRDWITNAYYSVGKAVS